MKMLGILGKNHHARGGHVDTVLRSQCRIGKAETDIAPWLKHGNVDRFRPLQQVDGQNCARSATTHDRNPASVGKRL